MARYSGQIVEDLNLCSAPIVYTNKPFLSYNPIISGLVSPVAMVDEPSWERIFILDQIGIIYLYDPVRAKNSNHVTIDPNRGTVYVTNEKYEPFVEPPFLNIIDRIVTLNPNYDERGLLDMAFHPANPKLFYLWYTAPPTRPNYSHDMVLQQWEIQTAPLIVRSLKNVNIVPKRTIVQWPHLQPNHNGGTIAFSPVNKNILFLSVGDEGGQGDQHGEFGNAQNLQSAFGKIWTFYINDSGKDISQPELYTYGLRNPWRFSFNEQGHLLVGDVGQDLWEGLHLMQFRGENHGWRAYENAHVYDEILAERLQKENQHIVFPFLYYGREIGQAVIGGYLIDPQQYIFGDFISKENHDNVFLYSFGMLYLQPKNNQRAKYIESFAQDKKKNLYVLCKDVTGPSGHTGIIYQIKQF